MRLLDLFSGIGGFSLGLERAGFRTVAFCEIEPYPRAVLAKHWPGVPIYDDIRTLSADTLRRDGIAVDAICGGFPCQDLSFAGKRAGIEGARSGLWSEYARLIGEIRPRVAIMENVPGLLSAGHGRVLGDLAALGYDAVWDCIPASALGAPHRRDRVWIAAYAAGGTRCGWHRPNADTSLVREAVADASRTRSEAGLSTA
jgi:DNA (cytosine-5)-methyltransferase 1